MRGLYGTDPLRNAVHGSSNPEHAKATIAKIFGELSFNKDGSLAKGRSRVSIVEHCFLMLYNPKMQYLKVGTKHMNSNL